MAVTQRLLGLSGEMSPELDIQTFESRGLKVATGTAITREWSSGTLEGGCSFNELMFPMDGAFVKATPVDQSAPSWTAATLYFVGDVVKPATPNAHRYKVTRIGSPLSATNEAGATSGGTTPTFPTGSGATVSEGSGANTIEWTEIGNDTPVAERRDYQIDDLAADAIQTYSLEQGDRARARRYTSSYVMVTSFSISSERTGEMSVSADLLGRRLKGESVAVTTAGVVEADTVYGTPEMVEVYLDNTSAGLGTTRLDNASVEINLSDRFNPSWFHNRSLSSFLDHVEQRYSLEATIQIAEGSVIDTFLAETRAGQKKFLRLDVKGPQVNGDSGVRYRFQWDVCCQIGAPYSFNDNDGAYLVEIPLAAVRDATWAKSNKAMLITKKAA